MNLHLNEQEQQLLKNVLHALYKTWRREPGMNIGSCQCHNIYSEELQMMIDIHDRLVAEERKPAEPEYVWVFTADQVSDGEALDVITEVFATEEVALKHLHDFVYGDEGELEYAEKRGWTIEYNEPEHYRAFEEGYYTDNHTEATIERREVKH